MAKAWPGIKRYAVQVGRVLKPVEVGYATIVETGVAFEFRETTQVPFPSDPHYDAKVWRLMNEFGSKGATMWNVAGPASSYE